MSDVTRNYYRVEGKLRDVVEAWLQRREEVLDAQDALAAEYGGGAFPGFWGRMAGIHYLNGGAPDQEQLKALRLNPRKCLVDGEMRYVSVYVPNRRRKAGRELHARMEALKAPTSEDLTKLVAGKAFAYRAWTGSQMVTYSIVAYRVGDTIVLQVPDLPGPDLGDEAVLLKKSEYWQMKEAQDACAAEVGEVG